MRCMATIQCKKCGRIMEVSLANRNKYIWCSICTRKYGEPPTLNSEDSKPIVAETETKE